ncbi:MAG: hypothetical protein LAO31_08445, partial [Acidobacteriia bacterium]|nr:hypothetical protein [Terriglobia bacterium]
CPPGRTCLRSLMPSVLILETRAHKELFLPDAGVSLLFSALLAFCAVTMFFPQENFMGGEPTRLTDQAPTFDNYKHTTQARRF